jgi:Tol biopolymer transport system component
MVENADMPAVSPDGTRIAFVRRGSNGLARVWAAPLADLSRAVRLTGDDGGEWNHMSPAWSPDGTLLCYSGFSDLWLIPASGGRSRRLTADGEHDRGPVFTPDGKSILFTSNRVIPQSIWRVSLNGGAPERVLPGTGVANHPSISRDGGRLVFSTAARDRDVVVVDRKTGNVCRITSSRNDETPAMLPDGSGVVYSSDRLGTDDLWLEALQGGCPANRPARRLTSFNSGPVATPAFSSDGQWIAFFRAFKGHRDLWILPLNTGAARPLVEGRGDNIQPAFSPDGESLAFVSSRSGHEQIWILRVRDGRPAGEAWRLTEGNVTDTLPVWSPDGRRVAFVRDYEVWIVEARHAAVPARVTTGAEAHHLAWDPEGTTLIVSGLFGTPDVHLRGVELASGTAEVFKPYLVLGDRTAAGYISLSRDGRFLAADVTELKGNLWITAAPHIQQ